MPCPGALNPTDNHHPTFEKPYGDAARFSVVSTPIVEGEGFATKYPVRIKKIQPSLAQRCFTLGGIAGDLHMLSVYTI